MCWGHRQRRFPRAWNALAADACLYPSAIAQRPGHFIDMMVEEGGIRLDTEPLQGIVADARYRRLSQGDGDGERNQRWRVIVNTGIEHVL